MRKGGDWLLVCSSLRGAPIKPSLTKLLICSWIYPHMHSTSHQLESVDGLTLETQPVKDSDLCFCMSEKCHLWDVIVWIVVDYRYYRWKHNFHCFFLSAKILLSGSVLCILAISGLKKTNYWPQQGKVPWFVTGMCSGRAVLNQLMLFLKFFILCRSFFMGICHNWIIYIYIENIKLQVVDLACGLKYVGLCLSTCKINLRGLDYWE